MCVYVRGLNGDVRLDSDRSGSVEVEMYRAAGLPEKPVHHREESVKTALYVTKRSLDM